MKRSILVLALCVFSSLSLADEGMWMPQQFPELEPSLRRLGFTGDVHAFADLTGHPMGAIVQLPGCSASFVSPDGLIVTNHHCAAGVLQFLSKPDRNLLEAGFVAKTRAEEPSAGPGYRVLVTVSVREVTPQITGDVPSGLSDRDYAALLERRLKERTADCEKGGLRCRVSSFFEGLRYFEIAQQELSDVRLAYAPPSGIGVFGGETDNWQWPRHTGDWAFFRAYVSPEGKPAAYAKENVPFHPKRWLQVSAAGVSPGDLVFVAGYPGRTERHQTYAEVKETSEWALPRVVRRYAELIALLDEVSKGSKETEIRVTSRKRGLNNTLTNSKGTLQGLLKGGYLARKEASERELLAWIEADGARRKEFGGVLPALDELQAESERTRERDATFRALSSSSLLGSAQTIYRFAVERAKPDAEREAEYQERNWRRLRESQERLQSSLDATADRAQLRYVLREAAALPAGQRIEALDKAVGLTAGMPKDAAEKALDAFLARLYQKPTILLEKASRVALLDKPTAELVATKDPFLTLAATLHPFAEELRERGKRWEGRKARLRPLYIRALLAKAGGLVAPDANSTLRVTYGRVLGVTARDGLLYLPQTTLEGILEKQTGSGDFNAPPKFLEAVSALRHGKTTRYLDPKLNDVPVNFLSTVDTTGGNSGSATLNARGELCGLLFDGTYESVASDIVFDAVHTRGIHVDSRYFLWTMSEVDGAAHLVEEMGLGNAP